MTQSDAQMVRLALIAALVGQAADRGITIGRTALVKCIYLLEEIKGLRVGYDFRLYTYGTYGPFDAKVLDDLQYAESLGAVEADLFIFLAGTATNIDLAK